MPSETEYSIALTREEWFFIISTLGSVRFHDRHPLDIREQAEQIQCTISDSLERLVLESAFVHRTQFSRS